MFRKRNFYANVNGITPIVASVCITITDMVDGSRKHDGHDVFEKKRKLGCENTLRATKHLVRSCDFYWKKTLNEFWKNRSGYTTAATSGAWEKCDRDHTSGRLPQVMLIARNIDQVFISLRVGRARIIVITYPKRRVKKACLAIEVNRRTWESWISSSGFAQFACNTFA